MTSGKFTLGRALALGLCLGALALLLGMLPAASSAAGTALFDSIPAAYPGGFPSLGFEATSTDEFGDHVMLAAAGETLGTVVVSLTDWACENDFTWDGSTWVPDRDGYAGEACVTTPGSSFEHPITLNIYEVDTSGVNPALGPLIATKTATFDIPFRPSYDATYCYTGSGKSGALSPGDDKPFGGTWYSAADDRCFHGYAFNLTFDFAGDNVVLPQEVIVGVAYNTANHGAAPIGVGGPYSSLNVSLNSDGAAPTIGTDVESDAMFWDTSYAPNYTDGGAGGVDIFRRDTNWTPYSMVMQINAAEPELAAVFVSPLLPGTVDAIDYGREDVLKYDVATDTWSLFFDGSAYGLTMTPKWRQNVNAIYVPDPDSPVGMVMSFWHNRRPVPGIAGYVYGQDLVEFNGTDFDMYFDGSDVGLTVATAEKIDSLHILPGAMSPIGAGCQAYLLISTQGPGKVPNHSGGILKFKGADVLGFCATNLGYDTTGLWHMVVSGAAEGMPPNSTDSLSANEDGSVLYLTTRAAFNVDSATGGHSMVYVFDRGTGEFSGPIFSAPDAGLTQKVDALDLSFD